MHEVEQKMFHELQDKMRQMPLLIEVETNYGKVCIVHAEVRPTYASWQEVIEKAQSYTSTQFAGACKLNCVNAHRISSKEEIL